MLFSFSLNDSRCLTASKGEQLIVFLHKSPPDWYLCQNAHGQRGIIPRNRLRVY
ncbi:uncharacterized protein [Blastocystis hominis]|uniref:SH3 domain-containing protein n=1 Tax=Blastocystis hominis TaxID=12968 RepID=D8M6B7_BLAHO|nr:uncharacterized protein [Blastocystis hominis]CBK23670.2 unnamed protein product [Blastocystis hominis]|eukprot:XP_012897718.1 uncharacterized protein [Blastocystis hominis]